MFSCRLRAPSENSSAKLFRVISNIQSVVSATETGLRLDHWLAIRNPTSSRVQAEAAIAAGTVLVNGRRAAKGRKLVAGDTVWISHCMEKSDLTAVPDAAVPLVVVFADKFLLACDKPARMPVHPQRAGETGTLVNALLARFPGLAGLGGDTMFPAFVHRLDTDTSGLVLAACTEPVYVALRAMFRLRKIHKEYLVLVHGRLERGGRLEHEIAHHRSQTERMVIVTDRNRAKVRRPMRAVTEFEVAEPLGNFTLLRVVIKTGVTHQIRCQFAELGHAVVGDRIYGAADADALGLTRHFLHAARLEFAHPVTGFPLRLEALLPAELTATLVRLRSPLDALEVRQ